MKTILSLILFFFVIGLPLQAIGLIDYNKGDLTSDCQGLDTVLVLSEHLLKNNEVFFLGEVHYASENPCLKIEFIKYLYKNAKVRNIVQEIGPATAFFVNQYLETGEQRCLEKIINPFALEKEYLLDLYEFNQGLEPSQKLRMIGIDLDYFCDNIKALIEIFDQADLRNDFKWILEKLKEIPQERKVGAYSGTIRYIYPLKVWKSLRKELKEHLEQFPKFYQEKLGENLYYLESILASYSYNGPSSESFKYENFMRADQVFGQFGKYFVNYGAQHARKQILIEGVFQGQMLAAQLIHKKKSPFHNKVLSIGVVYAKSSRHQKKAIFKHMRRQAKEYFTLYDMNPLYEKYSVRRKHYHYIILVKNE